MPQKLWQLLFRVDRLMRVLVEGDLSATEELAEVARELEDLSGRACLNPKPSDASEKD